MKKALLLSLFAITSTTFFSQVVCFVFPPAETSASYSNTYPDIVDGWDLLPDMTNPANNVIDTLAIIDDGIDQENDGCEELINPEEIDGKIAMVWRNTCGFSTKALHCQNAGAVGVIIVSNSPDDVSAFGMLGGDDGPLVTIPVILINEAEGNLIADEIIAGGVLTALIGQIDGAFENNVGAWDGDFIRFDAGAKRTGSASLTEDVQVGTFVKNFGTQEMTDVVVNATINDGNTDVYDESSTPVNIPVNDSVFISMPVFSGDISAEGNYTLNYNIATGLTDEFSDDNNRSIVLHVNEHNYASCRIGDDNMPVSLSGFQPASMGVDDDFSQCIVYRESNASESMAEGLYFGAVTNAEFVLTEHIITGELYIWEDDFVDVLDDNIALDELVFVRSGSYEYLEDLQNEYQYIEFTEGPFYLEDDVRYLFCATSTTNEIFLGYDQGLDYQANQDAYLQPISITNVNGDWNPFGFGVDTTPSIVAKLAATDVSVNEQVAEIRSLEGYPNPAADFISIPVSNGENIVEINIYDISGKLVSQYNNKQHQSKQMNVDVSELPDGYYSFKAVYADGSVAVLNVVVNK